MNRTNRKQYVLWIILAEAVGALSGLISAAGMAMYAELVQKPPFSPPGWVFGLVWPILYALMGIGAARVWLAPATLARSRGLNLFIAQLIVNFFWSPLFFSAQAYGFAFFWLFLLWVLVLIMIVRFGKIDRPAAALQIPYLLWLTLAAVLNFAVWRLNG